MTFYDHNNWTDIFSVINNWCNYMTLLLVFSVSLRTIEINLTRTRRLINDPWMDNAMHLYARSLSRYAIFSGRKSNAWLLAADATNSRNRLVQIIIASPFLSDCRPHAVNLRIHEKRRVEIKRKSCRFQLERIYSNLNI